MIVFSAVNVNIDGTIKLSTRHTTNNERGAGIWQKSKYTGLQGCEKTGGGC